MYDVDGHTAQLAQTVLEVAEHEEAAYFPELHELQPLQTVSAVAEQA